MSDYEAFRDRQQTAHDYAQTLRDRVLHALTFTQQERTRFLNDLELIRSESNRNNTALLTLQLQPGNAGRSYYTTNFFATIEAMLAETELAIRNKPMTLPQDPHPGEHGNNDNQNQPNGTGAAGAVGGADGVNQENAEGNARVNESENQTQRPTSPMSRETINMLLECDKIRQEAATERQRDREFFANQMQSQMASMFETLKTTLQIPNQPQLNVNTGAYPKGTIVQPSKMALPKASGILDFSGPAFTTRQENLFTPTQPNIFSKNPPTQPRPQFAETPFHQSNTIPKPSFNDPLMQPYSEAHAPMSETQYLARMVREVQLNRIPMVPPKFPRLNPYKNFHAWNWGMNVYEETNPMISDHVKIQHLLKACEDTDAYGMVSEFSIASDSYAEIMQMLRDRYMVPRIVLAEFFNRAINMSPQAEKPASSDNHLQVVVDTFRAMTRNIVLVCKGSLAAKNIANPTVDQINAEVINAIYSTLIYRVLNEQMRTHLSSALRLHAMELPDFNQLINAVERRFVASQGASRGPPAGVVRQTVNATVQRNCLLCPSVSHDTAFCPKLIKKKTFEEKRDLLKQNKDGINICWICLNKPYGSCDCTKLGKSCANCGGRHNKVMCYAKTSNSQVNAVVKPKLKKAKKANKEEKLLN